MTGRKFGRLVVLDRADDGPHGLRWRCRCDCGNEPEVYGMLLRGGRTLSCGCFRRERGVQLGASSRRHGHAIDGAETSTYRTWVSMLQRCTNDQHPDWANYGGRGITVCERWQNFENFLADMGERPQSAQRLTLERVNNARGYESGNCEWRTYTQQARNRRNNHVITLDGTSRALAAWLEITGTDNATYHRRKRKGWTDEEALLVPSQRVAKKLRQSG